MSAANHLPPSWLSSTLGQVVSYGTTDKAEPEEISSATWVLELEDIERDSSRVLQRVTFSDRRSKSTKNRFSRGDVLYGKLRPYLNKVVYADAPGVCTTEIVPIKPGPALVGRYLFYWLRHPAFLQYVTEVSHGVNMPRLGTEAGLKAPLVIAPLREQQRISDKLDVVLPRVDACRDRLARVAPLLKRFRQSVLAAATSGRLTEDWRQHLLGIQQHEYQAAEVSVPHSQRLTAPKSWRPYIFDQVIELIGGSQPPKTTFVSHEQPGYVRLIQIRDYKSDRHLNRPGNLGDSVV